MVWALLGLAAALLFFIAWFIVSAATCSLCQWTEMRHFSYHVRYNWITRFVWFKLLGKPCWPK